VQSKIAACTAHLRQWAASANLYAADNQGWLPCKPPAIDPSGGGAYAWDIGTQVPLIMKPYQLTVPMWFDPFRSTGYPAYLSWVQANSPDTGPLSDPMNLTNVIRYFVRSFPNELSWQQGYCYWVPRYNGIRTSGTTSASLFPKDYSQIMLRPPWATNSSSTSLTYGWPLKIHDGAVPYVPFMSDTAGSGYGGLNSPVVGPNTTNIATSTAHFVNGRLIGVNLAFADGHVAGHSPDQMQVCYSQGGNYWFY
jgi:prepilin-type processing-associated H-X9-DG protein